LLPPPLADKLNGCFLMLSKTDLSSVSLLWSWGLIGRFLTHFLILSLRVLFSLPFSLSLFLFSHSLTHSLSFSLCGVTLPRATALAQRVQDASGSRKLADFTALLDKQQGGFAEDVQTLRDQVEAFASGFDMPGPAPGEPIPF